MKTENGHEYLAMHLFEHTLSVTEDSDPHVVKKKSYLQFTILQFNFIRLIDKPTQCGK